MTNKKVKSKKLKSSFSNTFIKVLILVFSIVLIIIFTIGFKIYKDINTIQTDSFKIFIVENNEVLGGFDFTMFSYPGVNFENEEKLNLNSELFKNKDFSALKGNKDYLVLFTKEFLVSTVQEDEIFFHLGVFQITTDQLLDALNSENPIIFISESQLEISFDGAESIYVDSGPETLESGMFKQGAPKPSARPVAQLLNSTNQTFETFEVNMNEVSQDELLKIIAEEFEDPEEFRSYLFSMIILEGLDFYDQEKISKGFDNEDIIVFPETLLFKAIKFIPTNFAERFFT